MGRTRCVSLLAVALALLMVPTVAEAALFKTPSGNIACGTGPNAGPDFAIVCTVLSEANSAGQKLWAMSRHGRVKVFRSMSNAATQVSVLRYGETYNGYGVRCMSRERGLRCRNRSDRGFFLSRERQSVF